MTSQSELGSSSLSSASSALRPRGFVRRHAVKLAASVVLTCGIVYTVHKGGMKFLPEGGDFK
ncbi:MAG: hypothetical protein M3O46_04305, partial [Myxococcota bacterium]|nr:hypothetical protein [Myxococcota bacterium]